MAVTVETGAQVAGADSYVSEADADTYCVARYGATDTFAAAATASQTMWLIRAAAYLDGHYGQRYSGQRSATTQSLVWPRAYATRKDVYLTEPIDNNVIPEALKDAQIEVARRIADGTDPLEDQSRGGEVTRETVGPITVEYGDSATPGTDFPQVTELLRPYLVVGGSTVRAVRA